MNFAGFRWFTWISWLHDRMKYQKPWLVPVRGTFLAAELPSGEEKRPRVQSRQKCGLHTGLLFLGPFSLPNGVSAAKTFPRTHTSEPACRLPLVFYIILCYNPAANPGFFLGGGALVSCSTSTAINHIVFFLQNTSCIRKPQVISGRGGAHPLHPPPRSAPVIIDHYSSINIKNLLL